MSVSWSTAPHRGGIDPGCGCGIRGFASQLLAEKARGKGAALAGAGAMPGLRECPRRPGTWHLVRSQEETGFSDAVKLQVRTRAGYGDPEKAVCEACACHLGPDGGEFQHRYARGMGGCRLAVVNGAANAALLCGSGALRTGDHGLCERRDRDMHGMGFWLKSGQDPRAEAVMLYGNGEGSGITVWLPEAGSGYLYQAPGEMAALCTSSSPSSGGPS